MKFAFVYSDGAFICAGNHEAGLVHVGSEISFYIITGDSYGSLVWIISEWDVAVLCCIYTWIENESIHVDVCHILRNDVKERIIVLKFSSEWVNIYTE